MPQFYQFSDIKYFITLFSPLVIGTSVAVKNDACGGHNHIEMFLIMREELEKNVCRMTQKADLYIIEENFPLIIDEALQ